MALEIGERYRVAWRPLPERAELCIETLHYLGGGDERTYWIPVVVRPDAPDTRRPRGIVIPRSAIARVGSVRNG